MLLVTMALIAGVVAVIELVPPSGGRPVAQPTAAAGPLQEDPAAAIATSGRVLHPGSTYTTYGTIVYDTAPEPVRVVGWSAIRARHLTVLGLALVPYDDGANAGAGLPGWPPRLGPGPARAQPVDPGMALVSSHGAGPAEPLDRTSQWVVVGYRLAHDTDRSASLDGIELTYQVTGEPRPRHLTLRFRLHLCRDDPACDPVTSA